MSVYQRKSDMLWIAAWHESGKKKTRAFKDEQTARAFDGERLSRLNRAATRLTLGELAAAYSRSRPDLHPDTRDAMLWLLIGSDHKDGTRSVSPGEFLCGKFAEALTRQDLERLREGFRAKGSSNRTINKNQAYIHAILSWGVEQELIQHNPWRDFKHLPVHRAIMSTSLGDLQKVYRAATPWMQWAIKTMYALTIRPGLVELFGLQWSAFDFRRGTVQVRQGKSKRIKLVFPPQEYLAEAIHRYAADAEKSISYVCHKNGKPVRRYLYTWGRAISQAGVAYFPMYHIRHIAVSEALARGADLAAVSAQAGHSSVATTSIFYAHVVAGAQQRAAALMPSLDAIDAGTR